MIAFKFNKSAILTGFIDSYCLVCESHLRGEDEIDAHIFKPMHKKNLDSTNYEVQFKDDYIRKLKKGYYCQFCNILLLTSTKVGLHVVEARHCQNKGVLLLKNHGKSVVAFGNIVISENAWNSVIDNTCAICNTEYDDEESHKTESEHILRLVQTNIEFDGKLNIYRKIDENSFQCLTCNLELASITLPTHFEEPEHIKRYQECRQDNIAFTPTTTIKVEPVAIEKPVESKTEPKAVTVTSDKKTKHSESKAEPSKKSEKRRSFPEVCTLEFDEKICKSLGAKDYIGTDDMGKQFCLLCDWNLENESLGTHLYGQHHQTMLKMHKERMQKKARANEAAKTVIKNAKPKEVVAEVDPILQENKSKILDAVQKFQANDVNINFEYSTAVCKKCNKNIEFLYENIESHIEMHKKKSAKKDTKPATVNVSEKPLCTTPVQVNRRPSEDKSDRASSVASSRGSDEESEKYAKANNLVFNSGDTKVYCPVCNTKVPFSLKNMQEHVNGSTHKNKAFKVSECLGRPVTVKETMRSFIKTITAVENMFMKDMIINEKFVINILSFTMISKENSKWLCHPCDMHLNMDQVDGHKLTPKHERAMCETVILTSMESEFIREVRPGVYHCGFCNITRSSINDLEVHLKTTTHRESKSSANWRLQSYMEEIIRDRRKNQIEMMHLMRALVQTNM